MRYLLIVALLSGCAGWKSAEQLAIDEYGRQCELIGHAKGTEKHKDCVTTFMASAQRR